MLLPCRKSINTLLGSLVYSSSVSCDFFLVSCELTPLKLKKKPSFSDYFKCNSKLLISKDNPEVIDSENHIPENRFKQITLFLVISTAIIAIYGPNCKIFFK